VEKTGGRPLVPEILGQSYRVGAKSPIFDLFLLVATQLVTQRITNLHSIGHLFQLSWSICQLIAFDKGRGASRERSIREEYN